MKSDRRKKAAIMPQSSVVNCIADNSKNRIGAQNSKIRIMVQSGLCVGHFNCRTSYPSVLLLFNTLTGRKWQSRLGFKSKAAL